MVLPKSMMRKYTVWLYSWLSTLFSVNALYFFLDEGTEKCFFQELANETLLVANYRCSLANGRNVAEDGWQARAQGMVVEIKDPRGRTVLSRPYRHKGRFSFKSHEPGVHTICLRAKRESYSKDKTRIDFDLQVGEHAMNRAESVKRKHLLSIEEKYQQLLDKAIEINKEIDYLRYREEMFRGTTETISRRVLLWMVGETLLLVIIGVWQMENLRQFFESKKLV